MCTCSSASLGTRSKYFNRCMTPAPKKGGPTASKLTVLNNLATAYAYVDNTPRAVELLEQVWKGRLDAFGAADPETIMAAANLGMVYLRAGKPQQAIELLGPAYEMCVKKFGAKHYNTLVVLGNLAMGYMLAGNYAKAIELVEPTHGEFVKVLGAEHAETFIICNNLATAYEYARPASDRRAQAVAGEGHRQAGRPPPYDDQYDLPGRGVPLPMTCRKP